MGHDIDYGPDANLLTTNHSILMFESHQFERKEHTYIIKVEGAN